MPSRWDIKALVKQDVGSSILPIYSAGQTQPHLSFTIGKLNVNYMNYAEDIFKSCVNEWNNLTKKQQADYLKKYVQSNKRKKTTRNDR